MSKVQNPLAQTTFVVSNVRHKKASDQLNHDEPFFTWIKNQYTKVGKKSLSLNQTRDFINSYTGYNSQGKKYAKGDSPALLKGLYNDTGYNGVDCIKSAPYLFFDIDVKNTVKKGKVIKENVHLLNPPINIRIFEELENIAVLTWRTNSGNGISGVLHVPQLAEYTEATKDEHRKVGEAITKYVSSLLHEITGIEKIKFDQAQSKFRQLRYVAKQNTPRQLNPNPYVFFYDAKTEIKKNSKGVTLYKPNYNYNPNNKNENSQQTGKISEQFNNDTQILPLMLQFSFEQTNTNNTDGSIRVKHPLSSGYESDKSTGAINTNENVYYNHSTSIMNGKGRFTPFEILQYFKYDGDKKSTEHHLKQLGYKEIPITTAQLISKADSLKDAMNSNYTTDIDKLIYSHCAPLQNATNEQKYDFISKTCKNPEHEKYFFEYLKLTDYTIKFDKKIIIKKYVSEALTDILKYADDNKKIVVKSDTGNGKTFAFVDVFGEMHPEKKILILAPLTIIVDQNRKKYSKKGCDKYAFLTGSNKEVKAMFEHEKVKDAQIVFATYEQGSKWLKHLDKYAFQYVIVDEIHQLITANSFKKNVISELTPLLNKSTVIGLTGSPSQLFNQLGYKMIDVDVEKPTPTQLIVRYSNLRPYNIALNHLTAHPTPQGKVLMRINSIATINELTDQLVKLKMYKRSEILILHSTAEIKNSIDYTTIAHRSHFSPQYKLILTTALIDEGVSIRQDDFSDVVFIDTNYNPRPEPVKQFFARFRNTDPDRLNYLYLKHKRDQTPTNIDPEYFFNSDLHDLQNEADKQEVATQVLNTYNHIFSNNNYYFDNGTVNPYYLAYAVTKSLYDNMNNAQYIEYLERNYNLSITVDTAYEIKKIKANIDTAKKLKVQIADIWLNNNLAVLEILRTHSQDPELRLAIHPTMTNTDEIFEFTCKNIKQFEKLYKRTHTLKKLGVETPNDILINYDAEPITLHSDLFYSQEINFQTANNTINNPITNADFKAKDNFLKFAQWCLKQGRFSNKQMIYQLKRYGVKNHKAFNEKNIFDLLSSFKLDARRVNHNLQIEVKNKKGNENLFL